MTFEIILFIYGQSLVKTEYNISSKLLFISINKFPTAMWVARKESGAPWSGGLIRHV